jgi:pSer/pThr/pTyr-binding forkhead associated (FHA) protein
MEVITIGRDHSNNIVISDSKISRYHAQVIKADNGAFSVADMGSTNGTFVNGMRITSEVPLFPGDSLVLGVTNVNWQQYFDMSTVQPLPSTVQPFPNQTGVSGPFVPPPDRGKSLGSKTWVWIVAAAAVLLLAGGIAFFLLHKNEKQAENIIVSNEAPEAAPDDNMESLDIKLKDTEIYAEKMRADTEKKHAELQEAQARLANNNTKEAREELAKKEKDYQDAMDNLKKAEEDVKKLKGEIDKLKKDNAKLEKDVSDVKNTLTRTNEQLEQEKKYKQDAETRSKAMEIFYEYSSQLNSAALEKVRGKYFKTIPENLFTKKLLSQQFNGKPDPKEQLEIAKYVKQLAQFSENKDELNASSQEQ